MKIAKRLATVLRIIGWVMVGIAVGVTIYALATSGGPWGIIDGWLNEFGVKQNAVDRVEFDRQFYNALIDAADTKNMQETLRFQRVRTFFEKWEERLNEAVKAESQRAVDEFYQVENESLNVLDAAAVYIAF